MLCNSQLEVLHAVGQVWLPDSVLQQCEKLALRFFRSASIAKNAASHINLGPKRMQYKKASIDWLKRDRPAWVIPFALLGTNQSNWRLKLKGFNFDVMLIEQVVVFFNALNDFFDSDKRNKILHSKN